MPAPKNRFDFVVACRRMRTILLFSRDLEDLRSVKFSFH